MISRKRIIFVLSIIALSVTASFARNILEKKMFYLNSDNKQGQALYWVIYLGNYDCKLTRKFPGEAPQQIDASMNLQYISSGYIEGNGYSAKGKVDCLPTMFINNANGKRQITSDSIDYIYDYGQKVQMINGESGELIINLEGEEKYSKKFLMREYKLTDYFGEKILKEGSTEVPLSAFSYSKDGLARAIKAQASTQSKQ